MTADEIVRRLGLQRHPEGGWYKETFRDQTLTDANGRAASTAIYYLLPAGERSAWHRVLDAMVRFPILVERPIVVTARGTRLCRPVERVQELLPA